ncbi:MAG: DUF853 family protein, partial [Deltaproteobacteria bacterium]|nr:DUF853 family protein [Deltaproteobacteria bacterium]
KVAAETFRANPKLDTTKAILELAVGEALISVLDEKGAPTMVEKAWVLPPHSRLGTLTPDEIAKLIKGSVLYGHYEKTVDRESAYEKLKEKTLQLQKEGEVAAAEVKKKKEPQSETGKMVGAAVKSAAHAIGSQLGRQIMRGVLGSIFGSKR